MVYTMASPYKMRTQRTYEGRCIWAEPVDEIVFEVDSTTHKVGITVFDYGNPQDYIILDHFVAVQGRFNRTYMRDGILTPLIEELRKNLFKDLRRELPDNRSEEKQKLLIVKAMQELM